MNYIKTIYLSVLLVVGITACKKHENPASNTTNSENYLPSKSGSYFVYQWYSIDSNLVETQLPNIDTVFVLNDTTINQQTFVRHYGNTTTPGGLKQFQYMRDSSGYIINEMGQVIYSYSNFTDILKVTNENWVQSSYKMTGNQLSKITPAGTFETIESTLTVTYSNGQTTNCGGTSYSLKTNYAPNVGVVTGQCAFVSMVPTCSKYERRLLTYYIP